MRVRSISISDLRRELARRERGATKLAAQRDKLRRQLDRIAAALADLGVDGTPKRRGRPPGRRGPGQAKGSKNRGPGRPKGSKNRKPGRPKARGKNSMTLAQAMAKGVRVGTTVSIPQVAAAAKKAGYKSTSKNLAVMVGMAIAKAKEFKRVGRGQYVRKG